MKQSQTSAFCISIHAFRVEGDSTSWIITIAHITFQSTPSVWKATDNVYIHFLHLSDFNPRLPCGRRLAVIIDSTRFKIISIHAFRVEGDRQPFVNQAVEHKISIHAFRVEGDIKVFEIR